MYTNYNTGKRRQVMYTNYLHRFTQFSHYHYLTITLVFLLSPLSHFTFLLPANLKNCTSTNYKRTILKLTLKKDIAVMAVLIR
jgi:hypothetical protein